MRTCAGPEMPIGGITSDMRGTKLKKVEKAKVLPEKQRKN